MSEVATQAVARSASGLKYLKDSLKSHRVAVDQLDILVLLVHRADSVVNHCGGQRKRYSPND
jgi:DNA-binding winged helix-turn-helix (wHTH) protein